MTLLITGGASGIGAATARLAAERGHKVAINYRSRDAQAKKVVADITVKGGQAVALPADVSREADIVSLFDAARLAGRPPLRRAGRAHRALRTVRRHRARARRGDGVAEVPA